MTASAQILLQSHPNVLRLTIHTTRCARLIRTALSTLPVFIRSCLESIFPYWTLPDTVILKQQKDGWEEDFNVERAAYEKLMQLQGHAIPILLGQVTYNGVRALILSDVGGASMATAGGALIDGGDILSETELQTMLYEALGTMVECGISHDDIKLDNFRRVERAGKRAIKVLDLERVDAVEPQEDGELMTRSAVEMLVHQYREQVKYLRNNGFLPA